MPKEKDQTKPGTSADNKNELTTEWPLSEKDEQSQAIKRTADIQEQHTRKKRKRIRRDML